MQLLGETIAGRYTIRELFYIFLKKDIHLEYNYNFTKVSVLTYKV